MRVWLVACSVFALVFGEPTSDTLAPRVQALFESGTCAFSRRFSSSRPAPSAHERVFVGTSTWNARGGGDAFHIVVSQLLYNDSRELFESALYTRVRVLLNVQPDRRPLFAAQPAALLAKFESALAALDPRKLLMDLCATNEANAALLRLALAALGRPGSEALQRLVITFLVTRISRMHASPVPHSRSAARASRFGALVAVFPQPQDNAPADVSLDGAIGLHAHNPVDATVLWAVYRREWLGHALLCLVVPLADDAVACLQDEPERGLLAGFEACHSSKPLGVSAVVFAASSPTRAREACFAARSLMFKTNRHIDRVAVLDALPSQWRSVVPRAGESLFVALAGARECVALASLLPAPQAPPACRANNAHFVFEADAGQALSFASGTELCTMRCSAEKGAFEPRVDRGPCALAAAIGAPPVKPMMATTTTTTVMPHLDDAFVLAFVSDTHGHVENTGRLARRLLELHARYAHVVLVDNGDASVGTRFYQQHGILGAARVLRWLHFDAFVLGNHDLDDTSDFAPFAAAARVWVLSHEPRAAVARSVVFGAGVWRVAIVGASLGADASAVLAEARRVRDVEAAGFVVVASHCGMEWDRDLRARAAGGEVDVVVGGHSHVSELSGGALPLVLHAGALQSALGVVDSALVARLLPLVHGASHDATEQWLAPLLPRTEERAVGVVRVEQGAEAFAANTCRWTECGVGALVAQAMRWWAAAHCRSLPAIPLVGAIEAGSLRGPGVAHGQLLTTLHLFELLPWANRYVVLSLNASLLRRMVAHGLRHSGARLQIAGAVVSERGVSLVPEAAAAAAAAGEPGVVSVGVRARGGLAQAVLAPAHPLHVVVTEWLAGGGDGFGPLVAGLPRIRCDRGEDDRDVDVVASFVAAAGASVRPAERDRLPFVEAAAGFLGGLMATLCTYPLSTMALERSVGHAGAASPAHTLRSLGPYVLAVGASSAVFWGFHAVLARDLGAGFSTSLAASVLATLSTHPLWVHVTHFRVHRAWAGSGALFNGLAWNLALTLFPAVRASAEALLRGALWPTPRFVAASLLATVATWPLQVARNRAQAGLRLRGSWLDGLGWQCGVSVLASAVFSLSSRSTAAALEWALGVL